MRILHVITSLRTGGAEKLMVDLLPRLCDLGHDVDLCVFDGVRTPFYEALEAKDIRVIPLRVGGSVYDPRNIFALISLIKNYDVVHTHNTACQLFAAVAHIFSPHPRLITTEHNTTNRRRGKWYLKLGDLWMYKQYEKIICISDKARENLVNYIGESQKIVTIFNGIDLHRFQQTLSCDNNSNNEHVITMVAAFRAQKDHKTLIKAFDLLPDNYLLQLVGDGELRLEIEMFAGQFASKDRIVFMGNQSDVPAILCKSEVVVLSSHYEGLSLSSIEGMASGRPFIASDVDGLHEIVSGTGILFPHEDAEALAASITKVCEDRLYARDVADHCQRRAEEFDISKMAERYSLVYEQFRLKEEFRPRKA